MLRVGCARYPAVIASIDHFADIDVDAPTSGAQPQIASPLKALRTLRMWTESAPERPRE